MVALPTPDDQLVTANPPQSRVGGDAFTQPTRVNPLQGADQLASGMEDVATTLAKQQAQETVRQNTTIDADGNVHVQTPQSAPIILGRAGPAYESAVLTSTQPLQRTQITNDINQIRQRNALDPNGDSDSFKKQVGDYLNGYIAKNPGPLGQEGFAFGAQLMQQHYDDLLNGETKQQLTNSYTAISNDLTNHQNTLFTVARQGGTDTGAFASAKALVDQDWQKLRDNAEMFGIAPEKIDQQRKTAEADLYGQQVYGSIDRLVADPNGGILAAQKVARDLPDDPHFKELGKDDQDRIAATVQGRILYNQERFKSEIAASKDAGQQVLAALRTGKQIDDNALDKIVANSTHWGDAETASAITAARFLQSAYKRGVAGLSSEQQFNTMFGGNTYLANLRAQENPSGSNTASPGTSSALGRYQFTQGTWDTLRMQHPELQLTPDGRTDPAQQDRAIVAFTNENRAALQRAGIQPTDKNTYMAHFLGAGGAENLISTMQQTPGAVAAKVLPDAAAANPSVFYKAGADGKPDYNNPRSVSEVYSLQTQRFSGATSAVVSANGAPFTQAQSQQNPYLMSEWVHRIASDKTNAVTLGTAVGDGIARQLQSQITPNPVTFANFQQIATQYPSELAPQIQKIRTLLQATGLANTALGYGDASASVTPAQGEALLSHADQLAQGGSIMQAEATIEAHRMFEAGQRNLKEHPADEALKRGWISAAPMPIDMSNPQALPMALQQHGIVAGAISSREGVPISAIFPAERAAVKAMMTNGPIDHRLALLGAIGNANMPAPVKQATLDDLGKDQDTQALAVASKIAAENPDAARGILQGEALLQNEKRLAPKAEDQQSAFMKSFPANDFAASDERNGVLKAATAYYANLSASANDTSERLNQDRWDQSVKAVTGGIYNYRGSNVYAPWYGASEPEFRGSLQSLTDADMAGAHTADGAPFPASALQSRTLMSSGNWRLQSLGNSGRYLVFSGDDTNRRYLQGQNGAFVLNLSGKRGNVPNLIPGSGGVRGIGMSAGPALTPDTPDLSASGLRNFAFKPTLPVSSEMGQVGKPAL